MRVLDGLLFFPRGGSAHVARALATELPAHGWDVTLLTGSLPGLGDAEHFYDGLDLHAADLRDAPLVATYEDGPSTEERCVGRISDADHDALVSYWADELRAAGAEDADVLLLNHLTPLNEAAAQVAPHVPVVGQLHGTELMFLERVASGAPADWRHAEAWAERMRRWAHGCERLLMQTTANVERASSLLDVDPAVCTVLPNGFDPQGFRPAPVERAAFWQHHVGEDLEDAVVLVSVGRFTAVKRHGALIRAFAKAQRRTRRRAALVIVGGYPGEVEGEHPQDAIAESGAGDVFLAGWHDHDALPAFFNAADAQVLNSAREQFGLVLVEGMACGLPAIAINRLGPTEIVEDGRTGWLVEPEDEEQLVQAIVDAVDDGAERARRGIAARQAAIERWSWPAIAERLGTVLDDAAPARDGDTADVTSG
ncbi:MAG TPA: glycosyltransferase family 4 protein [Solirubrobacteraceae bacterium]